MSKAADITTLELIAAVHQAKEMNHRTFELLVHRLHQQVAHFEWVGLYLLSRTNSMFLKLQLGIIRLLLTCSQSILQVPIMSSCEDVLGKLMVTSSAVAFDDF